MWDTRDPCMLQNYGRHLSQHWRQTAHAQLKHGYTCIEHLERKASTSRGKFEVSFSRDLHRLFQASLLEHSHGPSGRFAASGDSMGGLITINNF